MVMVISFFIYVAELYGEHEIGRKHIVPGHFSLFVHVRLSELES